MHDNHDNTNAYVYILGTVSTEFAAKHIYVESLKWYAMAICINDKENKEIIKNSEENTASTVRKFLNEEMRIPDTGNISINSSHRMGQAGPGYNKMLIARIPRREDHDKIFDNASVLKGTNFYVSKQVPV